jgi:hypothetical protein
LSSAATFLFYVAGFLFGQVCDVASSNPAKTVTPVAFVVRGDDQQFKFFEGETLQDMVVNGRRELKSSSYDAWALAYEGYVIFRGHRRLALFVESWSNKSEDRQTIIQFLERSGDSISFLGSPLLLSEAVTPKAGTATETEPLEMSVEQQLAFKKGMSRQQEMRVRGSQGR